MQNLWQKIIFGGDLQDQFFFWKSYFIESIKAGTIPFWNPFSFSGTPFLAHPSISPLYPPNIIFFLFPVHIAFSVFLFVHIILAGYFTYWFLRKTQDKISATVGAILFAFSGLFAARIYAGHIDIIATLIWIPLVFGSVTSAITSKKKKDILIGIIGLTLQILAGYQFVVLLTLELLGLFVIYHVVAVHSRNFRRSIPGISRALLIFIGITIAAYGLSAIQILPTFELVQNSIRSKGLPYDLVTWGSSTVETLKLFIAPYFFGNPFPENYSYTGPGPNYFELIYFVGILPILLILFYLGKQIFLIFKNKSGDSLFFFYLSSILFFVLLSFGKNFFLHPLFFNLFSPYRLFRFPVQHLMMVVFLLAATTGRVVSQIHIPKLQFVILFFIAIELLSFDTQFIRLTDMPTKSFDRKLIDVLKKDKEVFRLLPDYPVVSQVRKDMDFESSSYYQIQTASGYNPIILDKYYHFIDLANKQKQSSIPYYNVEIPPLDPYSPYLDFLNIKYILSDTRGDLVANGVSNKKFQLILDTEKYRLYKNSHVLPRFFLVPKGEVYPSEKALEEALLTQDVDLSGNVLFLQKDIDLSTVQLNCQETSAGDVAVISYTPHRIKLDVKATCNGFLSSSEVYYPGWKATLDGKSVNIYRSNTAFRSLFVPQGEHTVEYFFVPKSYYIGGIISLVTLLALFIFWRRYEE